MKETERLVEQIHRIYEGSPWYGTPLLKLLKGVTTEKAAAKPLPNCHSIWELVLHIATWERIVTGRISGKKISEENWPPVTKISDAAWKAAVKRLVKYDLELRKAILKLSDEELWKSAGDGPGKHHAQIHGIIQHTMYHTGQIAMLKKALRRKIARA